jgi:uncharacterized protein (TIGR02145 family)
VNRTDYAPDTEFCMPTASRTNDFLTTKSFDYTFSNTAVYDELTFVVVDNNGLLVNSAVDATGKILTITFKNDIRDILQGKPQSQALKLTVYARFKDSSNNWKMLTLEVSVQDCDCCSCVTDIEGNVYQARRFGAAGCWMTENLATTRYPDNTVIPQKNNTNTNNEPYYWIPNLAPSTTALTPAQISAAYTSRVGLLYTWSAAAYGRSATVGADTANDPSQTVYQGICPQGWHLPSDYEYNQLEREIVANYTQYSDMTSAPTAWNATWDTSSAWRPASGSGHGTAMKSKNSPVGNSTASGGLSKASDFGWNGLLVGNAVGSSTYFYGSGTFYWSSTSDSSTSAWRRHLNSSTTGVYRDSNTKNYLFSVRCKKND